MSDTNALRGLILTVTTAAVLLLSAAVVWACVPQVGTLEAESRQNDSEVNTAEEDVVVADGDPDTRHFKSWCRDHGGHPVDAVHAGIDDDDEDDIRVTVNESTVDQVNGECPDQTSSLPEGETFIYVENDDVYVWDDGDDPDAAYTYDGFWDFEDGPGVGCYHSDANPVEQDTFHYDGTGQESHSFDLTKGGQTWDTNDPPGDEASVLCVGEDVAKGSDAVAIFAPLVVTEV